MKEFRIIALTGITLCFALDIVAQKGSNPALETLSRKAYGCYLSKPDSAILYSRKALTAALRENNKYYEGYACYVLSKTYWVKANYRLSVEYGFKALRIFERSPHKEELASTQLSVARTLTELGNYATAKQFLDKSLSLGRALGSEIAVGSAYREMSHWFAEKSMLDSALFYSDRGIELFEKNRDLLDASILYSRKARIYFQLKNYIKSSEFATKGLQTDSLVGNSRGLGVSYFLVARNDLALGNFSAAEYHLKQSIRVSSSVGNLTWVVRAHELLASLYMTTKRPALAAREFQLAIQFKDTLYNLEKSGQVEEMRSLYELEAKENQIKMLEQENTLKQQEVKNQRLFVGFLLLCVLLLLVLILLMVRLRVLQRKANLALATKNAAIEQQSEELHVQAEKLQQLNLLQTKLFSVISHDLRGPISNLHSLLELLGRQLLSQEEFLKISEKLRSNLNVTQRTLENLLNWALSQMDGIKTEKRLLDVGKCVEEAWRLMEESASRKNIALTKNWQNVHLAHADRDQVELILRNLIHNAIKFSNAGEAITISVKEDHSFCTICIQDNGIGMSQSEIDVIIGAKAHFSKRGTEQEKGTGLGLLLCKEFAERNDGRLTITSEPGKGTRVCITLPVA